MIDDSQDFSIQLKEGTKSSHNAAENTKFMRSFLKGMLNKHNFHQLWANYYFIYSAIEQEVYKHIHTNQSIGMIHNTKLYRVNSLESDLLQHIGYNWKLIIQPSHATQQYVNRIRDISLSNPTLLVAHHYTRYLGDLSGGQILKSLAYNALQLHQPLQFFEFHQIQDLKSFKLQYKAILDELPLDHHQVNDIIAEANYAFALNTYMFDELHGNDFLSFINLIKGALSNLLNK